MSKFVVLWDQSEDCLFLIQFSTLVFLSTVQHSCDRFYRLFMLFTPKQLVSTKLWSMKHRPGYVLQCFIALIICYLRVIPNVARNTLLSFHLLFCLLLCLSVTTIQFCCNSLPGVQWSYKWHKVCLPVSLSLSVLIAEFRVWQSLLSAIKKLLIKPVSQSCAVDKSENFGGQLDIQTWHINGWPQEKLSKFGFRTHAIALWPMEQSSFLSAKLDCPVAHQNFSLLATAHDCETGLSNL